MENTLGVVTRYAVQETRSAEINLDHSGELKIRQETLPASWVIDHIACAATFTLHNCCRCARFEDSPNDLDYLRHNKSLHLMPRLNAGTDEARSERN